VNVLLANKFFYRRGGSETVFFDTLALLEEAGRVVAPFAMHAPENDASEWSRYFVRQRDYRAGSAIARGRDAAASIYSLEAKQQLRALLGAFTPDVAHLHNIYHQLTMSIVDELSARGIPIVMTVHDYKPVCPNYQMFTEGEPCTRCVGDGSRHAVVHRCVDGSRAASTVAALEAMITRRRGSYSKISRFIVPSIFLSDLLIRGGFREDKIDVVPNPVALAPAASSGNEVGGLFCYFGRLTEQKGVHVLLDAAKLVTVPNVRIVVCGSGPLESSVRQAAHARGATVDYRGVVSASEVSDLLRGARGSLLPSVSYENCPMSILEANASGVPVVASSIGGVPELIDDGRTGLLVEPGDAAALAAAIDQLAMSPAGAGRQGADARERVRLRHEPKGYLDAVLDTYRRAGAQDGARSPILA
jgi:glycosyltransferase involved in cell wall biosynthesis